MTTVFLKLKANGDDIEGDSRSSQSASFGTIECISFQEGVQRFSDGSGRQAGKAEYEPLFFSKLVDRTSPLLNQALSHGAEIEATFSFVQHGSDGREAKYFSVKVENARLIHIEREVPDFGSNDGISQAATESIGIEFKKIEWKYEDGGISFVDDLTYKAVGNHQELIAITKKPVRFRSLT